jgi:transposase
MEGLQRHFSRVPLQAFLFACSLLMAREASASGRPAADHRRILNGILWILRTGAPWRDLPERYGPWPTIASHFYRWRKAGIWARLFAAVQQRGDDTGQLDWAIHYVDSTIVRAHQHAAGAHTGSPEAEALGRSQGGFSTKVHVRAEGGRGRPKHRPGRLVGDKAYRSARSATIFGATAFHYHSAQGERMPDWTL